MYSFLYRSARTCAYRIEEKTSHALSKETYNKYQAGKDFDDVVDKIKELVAVKRRLGSKKPRIVLAVRFIGFNKDCRSLSCKEEEIAGMIGKRLEEWFPVTKESIPYARNDYRLIENNPRIASFPKKLVAGDSPWRRIVMNWDGGVTVCCGIFEKKDDFGNIFKEPLKKIWNNEKYRAARRAFGNSRCDDAGDPCFGCPGWRM